MTEETHAKEIHTKAVHTNTAHSEFAPLDQARVRAAVREFLLAIGEDPTREGLLETPDRVARACAELFSGMQEDPAAHLHHILPFVGKAHVCYIPKGGRITGLSKIARCVMGYSRRLQVQERLCGQVADAMMAELDPLGVLVVMEAEHTCMTMRGVRSAGALTLTSAVRGIFKDNEKTRAEAMRLLGL